MRWFDVRYVVNSGLLLNEIIDGTRGEHEIDSPSPRDEGAAGENLLGKLYVIMKLEEK